jgi:hypothetical protein
MRCSCGCQRKVGLRDRRANSRAAAARKLVEKMEALAFSEDEDEYRRAFLFEGVSWRNQYVRVVHGELTSDDVRSQEAWRRWQRGARVAVAEASRDRRRHAGSA